jgi:hypothetical protein
MSLIAAIRFGVARSLLGGAAVAFAFPALAADKPAAGPDLEQWKKPIEIIDGATETKVELVSEGPPRRYRHTLLSPPASFEGIRLSMTGPISSVLFPLDRATPFELLWMTDYTVRMVDPKTGTPISLEFNCHSNLMPDVDAYRKKFPSALHTEDLRLFSIGEGQTEIHLPAGFAVPVRAQQTLDLQSQALNLNLPTGRVDVRHKTAIDFLRDKELGPGQRPKPLVVRAVSIRKPLSPGDASDAHAGHDMHAHHHGASVTIPNAATYREPDGGKTRSHWLVKPGREVSRTNVTQQLALPYDTAVHFAAAHLHPFAESMSLVDLTTKKTLFESRVKNFSDRVGLSEIDAVSSVAGIPLAKSHEYELVVVYNNTSDVDRDAMATYFLYLRAPDLEERLGSRAARTASAP